MSKLDSSLRDYLKQCIKNNEKICGYKFYKEYAGNVMSPVIEKNNEIQHIGSLDNFISYLEMHHWQELKNKINNELGEIL